MIGNATGASSLIGNAAAAGPMISGSFPPDRAAANAFVYSAAVISLVGRQTDVLGAEAASTERSLTIRYSGFVRMQGKYQCFGTGFNWVNGSGSALGIRFRIKAGGNLPPKRKKY
jgi:hypothetical protein